MTASGIKNFLLIAALLIVISGCTGLRSSTEISEGSDESGRDAAEASVEPAEEPLDAASLARDDSVGEGGLTDDGLSSERLLDEETLDYSELPPIDDELVRLAEEEGRLYTVYFGYDSHTLNDENKKRLRMNAKWLKEYPRTRIKVEGHADERGTDEYNLALGQRRAMSTQKYLVDMGIPETRTVTISYGEEMPADRSHDEASWSRNRRADFLLLD